MTGARRGLSVHLWRAAAAGLLAMAAGAGAATSKADPLQVDFNTPEAATALDCPARPSAYPPPPAEARLPSRTVLGSLAETAIRPPPPVSLPGLERLRGATPEHPFRIAWWGDSHVAAGPFPRVLAERLASRGQTVGVDMLPPSIGRANVRLAGVGEACIGPGWESRLAFQAREPESGFAVGPGLINRDASGGPDSWLALDFRGGRLGGPVRRLEILYRAAVGARLSIAVNDAAPVLVAAPGGEGTFGHMVINNTAPISTLRLTVLSSPFALQGFGLEPVAPPAVVLDVFGLPGSTVRGWAEAEPEGMAQPWADKPVDLAVLQYGTNESISDPARYEAELRVAVDHLRRAHPAAACLLVGPPDRGAPPAAATRDLDALLANSRAMGRVAEIQARVAATTGCAVWDWRSLMGGEGGAYGWAYATPPLMGPDLTHLTPAGYRLSAEALAHSLGY